MNNWDKFKSAAEQGITSNELPPSQELFGIFNCQVCEEEVEEAQWFYTDSVLKWRCSQGHVSFAENFKLT